MMQLWNKYCLLSNFSLFLKYQSTETVNGKSPKKTLGLVKGNTIRARWFGRDIAASIKTIVGGEIKSYTKMIDDERNEALDRMVEQAKEKGAIIKMAQSKGDVMLHKSSYIAAVFSPKRRVALELIDEFVEDFKASAPIRK